MQFLLCN